MTQEGWRTDRKSSRKWKQKSRCERQFERW